MKEPKQRILFWCPGGMILLAHLEASIALALKNRGHDVHMIICDGVQKACILRELPNNEPISSWEDKCHKCYSEIKSFVQGLGIPVSSFGEYISEQDKVEIETLCKNFTFEKADAFLYKNIYIGQSVRSAVLRYLQGYPLDGHEDVVPLFAKTALTGLIAAEKVIESFQPKHVFMSHGIYSEWGGAFKLCVKKKLDISTYMSAYVHGSYSFGRVWGLHPNPKAIRPHLWEQIKSEPLTDIKKQRIKEYFEKRYKKRECDDMGKIFKTIKSDIVSFKKNYGITGQKPVWALFTHMNWDAVSELAPMIYPDFDSWLLDSIEIMAQITDVQWLIKIHPVEVETNLNSGAYALIQKTYSKLPDHIKVIPPEEKILPADLYDILDGGITVHGTAGLELTYWGKPVILAGNNYYSRKGFTHDAFDRNEYISFLSQASTLGPLTESQYELAKKLIYAQLIQKLIPLKIVTHPDPDFNAPQFQPRLAYTLLPGQDPYIDFLCETIISDNDFILPDELVDKLKDIVINEEINKVKYFMDSGKLGKAEDLLKDLTRTVPTNPIFWNDLGVVLYRQKRFQEAYDCFVKSLKINPENPSAQNNMLLCLRSNPTIRTEN